MNATSGISKNQTCLDFKIYRYFVPYVYLREFMEKNFKDQDHNLPLTCIAVASGVGRLVFGYIADRPGVNRIMLQQVRGCIDF